jgi:tRNA(adenine34) deaminase
MPKRKSTSRKQGKWVREVKTVSTFPPEGIFTKDARTIAEVMASKEVSPKGIASGIRMVQFFINRAGKNLPRERKQALEEAKRILREKLKPESGRESFS